MKILVVDDHPLVRKGLISILSLEEDIVGIQEGCSVREAVEMLTKETYDIGIIDLRLGKEDGLEIVDQANQKGVRTKFVILTSSMRKEDFQRAQQAGVYGYILKEAFTEDIVYALRVVDRGKRFIDPEILEFQSNQQEDKQLDQLTSREKDVLLELGNGLSNEEIAGKLYISEHTVKKHVSNILSKLELNHRTQAALLAKDVIHLQF
ncbi:MAG: response regulator [Bacillota bacterium]